MDHNELQSAFSDDDEEREAEIALEEWVDEIECLLGGTSRRKEAKDKERQKERRELPLEKPKPKELPRSECPKRRSWIKQLVRARESDAPEPVQVSAPRRAPPAALLTAPSAPPVVLSNGPPLEPSPVLMPPLAEAPVPRPGSPVFPCACPQTSQFTTSAPVLSPHGVASCLSADSLPPRTPAPAAPLPNRPLPLEVPTDCDSDSMLSARYSDGVSLTAFIMLPPTFIPAREYYEAPCAYAVAQK